MQAVGVLFATQTGNTEGVAGKIAEAAGVEAEDIGDYSAEDLSGFDGLIVGCPTWNTGADEYRSGTSWDDIIDEIKELDLGGKPVAVFGCGDSSSLWSSFSIKLCLADLVQYAAARRRELLRLASLAASAQRLREDVKHG